MRNSCSVIYGWDAEGVIYTQSGEERNEEYNVRVQRESVNERETDL